MLPRGNCFMCLFFFLSGRIAAGIDARSVDSNVFNVVSFFFVCAFFIEYLIQMCLVRVHLFEHVSFINSEQIPLCSLSASHSMMLILCFIYIYIYIPQHAYRSSVWRRMLHACMHCLISGICEREFVCVCGVSSFECVCCCVGSHGFSHLSMVSLFRFKRAGSLVPLLLYFYDLIVAMSISSVDFWNLMNIDVDASNGSFRCVWQCVLECFDVLV